MRIEELDHSVSDEMKQLFKEVFSAPPWNEDWSDGEQLDKLFERYHGSA
ncbi:MAG: hypothetical protein IJL85_03300 [Erysipelotrichaceae bacterium]|nr:hypothetical protein [Erysipelotrichaceae bacterium]